MSELSTEQEEKLAVFKEITSYEETDHDKVIKLLRSSQWNLEIAIPRFFDGHLDDVQDPVIPAQDTQASGVQVVDELAHNLHSRRPPQPHRISTPLFDYQDNVPKFPKAIQISESWKFKLGLPPKIQARQGAVSPIIFIFLLIPRAILLLLTGLATLIDYFLPGFNKMLGLVKDPNRFPSENIYNDVQPEFQTFYDELVKYDKEDESLNNIRLQFFEGEYNKAYNFSKANLKWLLLVLINEECQDVFKSLVSHSNFRKFNDKNDVILWGGNVDYLEPFEVGKTYRVRKLPQLILIANVSKMGEFPLMSVVNKASVPINCSKDSIKLIFKKFQKSIDMYEPQLVSQRYDKHEQEVSRLIRREQDDAYHRSLLADKEKMEAKLQLKREEEERLLNEQLKEEERMKKVKSRESFLILKSIEMLKSRDMFERGNHTTIQFRLNTGERFIQKFLSSRSLYDIFVFIECKLFLKTFKEEIDDDQEILEILELEKLTNVVDVTEYEHEFNFELIQPIPRFILEPKKDVSVGDVKEIWPNGNLLVEFDPDDDDDDECGVGEEEEDES